MKTAAIYLAAGESRRMGVDKRSLLFNGVPLGSIVLKNALLSKLDYVVVVTRKEDTLHWIQNFFFEYPMLKKWCKVECEQASRGQGHSIQCGLKRVIEYGADAVMILLADQPFVTTSIINRLIDSYQKSPHYLFIAAENNQIPMPPILFSNECFPVLFELKEDQGAKYAIRKKLLHHGQMIDFKELFLFRDVDTFEDYTSLRKVSEDFKD